MKKRFYSIFLLGQPNTAKLLFSLFFPLVALLLLSTTAFAASFDPSVIASKEGYAPPIPPMRALPTVPPPAPRTGIYREPTASAITEIDLSWSVNTASVPLTNLTTTPVIYTITAPYDNLQDWATVSQAPAASVSQTSVPLAPGQTTLLWFSCNTQQLTPGQTSTAYFTVDAASSAPATTSHLVPGPHEYEIRCTDLAK